MFNVFARDLTQRIAAEEQLRQAQKMEALGQLTGGIAHDFNNVLTVISGTIEILAEEVSGKPETAAVARLISEAADRGAELTSHLLAFARKQPLQPREIDVNRLIVEIGKTVPADAGRADRNRIDAGGFGLDRLGRPRPAQFRAAQSGASTPAMRCRKAAS